MLRFVTRWQTTGTLAKSAILVAFFSVASRLLGVLRDRLLAGTFGAGSELDIYYAAFKIPDFIFNTFVLGALASALIPVIIQYRASEGKDSALTLTSQVFSLLTVILLACAVAAGLAAYPMMSLIAPGFSPEALKLSVDLSRIMMTAVVIFGASNVIGTLLQAEQKFFAFALAPLMYNVGIIAGLFIFVPQFGLVGLAWGVVLGSALHLLVQLPSARRLGFRWPAALAFGHSGVKKVVALILPRTLGLAAQQINQIITVSFVSSLTAGSLAAFNLAQNLQSFPINVFGVSLAIAVFPLLSQAYTANNQENFINHFSQSIRRILFYTVPLSVLFLVLRAQIVRVILGTGEFDWSATIRTAQVLGFLALAIVSDSVLPVVARAFYALKDTLTPVLAAVVSIVVNIGLLVTLKSYGLAGVGLAYVGASVVNLSVLLVILGHRLRSLNSAYIISGVWRMAVSALVAGTSAYGMLYLVAPHVNMNTFLGVFSQGALAGLAGVVSYLVVSSGLRLPEVIFFRRWLDQAAKLVTVR